MCGRYTLHTEKEALAERFDFDPADLPALAKHYNVAPTQAVVAIRVRDGARRAALLRWGLVPYFAKAIGALPLMINARLESLADKPAFRDSLKTRRCLIPANGFYEWQAPVPPRRQKQPHLIALSDGEPFAFAGLWASWRPNDPLLPERLESCTIVTTAANAALLPLHDRMPVILPRAQEAQWLDPALDDDVDALLALLQPVPPEALHIQPASLRVNSVENDDAGLLHASNDDDPQLSLL